MKKRLIFERAVLVSVSMLSTGTILAAGQLSGREVPVSYAKYWK